MLVVTGCVGEGGQGVEGTDVPWDIVSKPEIFKENVGIGVAKTVCIDTGESLRNTGPGGTQSGQNGGVY